jgi:anti-sigma factor (TIGR02949 family)
MSDCQSIDPLITPYVDGDIDQASRARVDDHVRRCPPCHSRVSAERAVRELVQSRRTEMSAKAAPETLRARCAALRATPSPRVRTFRRAIKPLAIAATVVLAAGGVFVYEMTDRSTRLLAAELTADHVKCFGVVNSLLGTNANAAAVEQVMSDVFGWQMHVPEQGGGELELVGARPCLYARGKAAHLMYRHHGQPLSLFMLPQLARPGKPSETLDIMGHEAAVWSRDGRTFVLIGEEPGPELERVASVVQASLH